MFWNLLTGSVTGLIIAAAAFLATARYGAYD